MKSIQLTGIHEMELIEVPDPTINKPDELLIRVDTVGVCGSDIHYYSTGRIGDQVVRYPFTVGHECAGIIMKTGNEVTRFKSGDRIAIDPSMPCWKCDQCKTSRPHTCRNLKFLGCPGQAEGCLSEYIVMPESSCFKIPDQMTMEEAAIAEPLSIGVYAVRQSIPLENASAGILGFGPIGFSVLLAAQAAGGQQFFVTDKIDDRLKTARQQGVNYTGNPLKQDIVKEINETEQNQLDVVYECCGDQEAIDQAIDILKPGGKLMIIGIPESERMSFNVSKMRHKEITIQNVRRQVDCVQQAIDLIANKKISLERFVTHRFTFNQTTEAFDLVEQYQDGVMKAMVNIL